MFCNFAGHAEQASSVTDYVISRGAQYYCAIQNPTAAQHATDLRPGT